MVDGVVPFDDGMAMDAAAFVQHAVSRFFIRRSSMPYAHTGHSGVAATTDVAWSKVNVPGASTRVVRR